MTARWPDQALVSYLDDPNRRATELDILAADMEALPPWSEIHQEIQDFGTYMDGLYAGSARWVASLYADEGYLATLSNLDHGAELALREKQASQVAAGQ